MGRLLKSAALAALFASALGGCSTYVTPRYSISADTNVALKSLGVSGVAVGAFSGPASFDNACRGAGPLSPPDGLSHTDYIKRALEDELKVAGAYAAGAPRVTLTGVVWPCGVTCQLFARTSTLIGPFANMLTAVFPTAGVRK
jgi:hypothetical protein